MKPVEAPTVKRKFSTKDLRRSKRINSDKTVTDDEASKQVNDVIISIQNTVSPDPQAIDEQVNISNDLSIIDSSSSQIESEAVNISPIKLSAQKNSCETQTNSLDEQLNDTEDHESLKKTNNIIAERNTQDQNQLISCPFYVLYQIDPTIPSVIMTNNLNLNISLYQPPVSSIDSSMQQSQDKPTKNKKKESRSKSFHATEIDQSFSLLVIDPLNILIWEGLEIDKKSGKIRRKELNENENKELQRLIDYSQNLVLTHFDHKISFKDISKTRRGYSILFKCSHHHICKITWTVRINMSKFEANLQCYKLCEHRATVVKSVKIREIN